MTQQKAFLTTECFWISNLKHPKYLNAAGGDIFWEAWIFGFFAKFFAKALTRESGEKSSDTPYVLLDPWHLTNEWLKPFAVLERLAGGNIVGKDEVLDFLQNFPVNLHREFSETFSN